MVHLTVALLNLQNHGTPTEDIQDVFNPQIVEESLEEEEVPQENIMVIPIPGPLLEILQTLQEIPPSPGPSLHQFLLQPIIVASSIPPLGSSPQLLCLLIEDSTVGVGATVEEFEEAMSHEAEMDVMVETLVKSEDEPLTNDPDAVCQRVIFIVFSKLLFPSSNPPYLRILILMTLRFTNHTTQEQQDNSFYCKNEYRLATAMSTQTLPHRIDP